jgi:hypothetical protein
MGSKVVLAVKPGEANTPWNAYIWRFCVSYQHINQVTRTFEYPIPQCDDAVSKILPWALFFLSMDLDAGYWQVELEKQSRSKLAFFIPSGKKWVDSHAYGIPQFPFHICCHDVGHADSMESRGQET